MGVSLLLAKNTTKTMVHENDDKELAYLEGKRREFEKYSQESVDPGLRLVWSRMALEATRLLIERERFIAWRDQLTPILPASLKFPAKGLRTAQSVKKWVQEVTKLLWEGKIDPKLAASIFQGLGLIKDFAVFDIEKNLREMEKRVKEMRAIQDRRIMGELDSEEQKRQMEIRAFHDRRIRGEPGSSWSGAVEFKANPPPPELESKHQQEDASQDGVGEEASKEEEPPVQDEGRGS